MTDLITALVVMLVVALAAAAGGALLARKARPRTLAAVVAAVVALSAAYVLLVHGKLALARVVPLSGAVVLTNLAPVTVAFLAGVITQSTTIARARRNAFALLLLGVMVFTWLHPTIASPPTVTGNTWTDGVCRQTYPVTCSPAAAATLLHHFGHSTTEAQMIDLCLTRANGTPVLGLYRGLRRAVRDTPLTVAIAPSDVDALIAQDDWPVIIQATLPHGDNVDPRYQRDWGWQPGIVHTVVIFGLTDDGKVEVGDPSIGREHWWLTDLKALYSGEGMRLVGE